MARTNDLDSATAQFYINVVDNLGLDKAKYCVFGKVTEGMDVVRAIEALGSSSGQTRQKIVIADCGQLP